MPRKNLILICDHYPVSKGEFFIDTEIKFLATSFKNIFILIKNQEQENMNRFKPSNLQVSFYKNDFNIIQKIYALRIIFSFPFYREIFNALFKFHIPLKPLLFKIIFNYVYSSDEICCKVTKLIKENKLKNDETVLYAYWHDEKAFAIARLKNKMPQLIAISRAHGSDIYFEAQKFVSHKFPYLPFKEFMLNNLTRTYTVSINGKNRFNQLFDKKYDSKINVNYLGVFNPYEPLLKKSNSEFTICSCSSIIPVKRLKLIVDIISHCNIDDLTWIHIGVGRQQTEIMEYAKLKIPRINVVFQGYVNNKDIFKFYCTNFIDLFINVSESEGLPVSIMEALSAAIPVMATDVGGTSDAVNNSTGFLLAKDFDTLDAAQKISSFFNLPVEKQLEYRDSAYKTWFSKFNSNINYQEFANEITYKNN